MTGCQRTEQLEWHRSTEKLDIRIITNKKKYHVFAYNKGLKIARGNYVSFPIGHSYYDEKYFELALKNYKENKGVAGVGGRWIINAPKNSIIKEIMESKLATGSKYRTSKKREYTLTAPTPLYKKSALVKAGGFNEKFIVGQYLELNLRLGKKNGLLIFDPEMITYYIPRKTILAFLKQRYYYAKARAHIMKEGFFRWKWIMPLLFTIYFIGAAVLSIKDFKASIFIVASFPTVFAFLLKEKKRGLLRTAKLTCAMITLYLVLGIGLASGFLSRKIK